MFSLSALIFIFGFAIFISVMTASAGKVPSLLGYSFMQVQTGSMEPKLSVGDVVIVKKIDTSKLQVGDVISFYSVGDKETQGKVITHRIVEKHIANNGNFIFMTKGDANTEVDKYGVYYERVIGKYVYNIGSVGSSVLSVLRNPKIIFIFIILPLIIICFSEAYTLIYMIVTNKLAKQEDEDDGEELEKSQD